MPKDDLPLLNMDLKQHRDLLKGYIDSLRGIHRFDITKVRDQRTLAQNAYFHGVVCPIAAKGYTETWGDVCSSERAKRRLKDEFLREAEVNKETGEVMCYETRHTSDLDIEEMSRFIEQCIEYCATNLGVEIPPAEQYRSVA